MRLRYSVKSETKIVVIVGGGFAGLNAAKALAHKDPIYVVLIDQKNHHLFQPLLYQVAAAGLDPGDIAIPIRSEFANMPNVEVHWGQVTAVDLQQRFLVMGEHEIEYDYLILACGAQHSYFNHPEWEEFAPGLKTLEQALEIRRRLLAAFELAENEFDTAKQEDLLTFVIVGGGPTGVELAGAFADISRTVLRNDFRRIDPATAKIILVEAGPRILAAFAEDLSARAQADLFALGVEVRTSSRVEKIDGMGVQIGSQIISTKNVFWAAGVHAAQMEFRPEVARDRAGRVQVREDFSLPQAPEVFVVGDMAAFTMAPGQMLPGLASAATQAGRFAASAILRSVQGESAGKFVYVDKGQMATIGRRRAVAQFTHFKMSGFAAWILWTVVHIFLLIGFKNRIVVMYEWAWSYLFAKRGSRLITERD